MIAALVRRSWNVPVLVLASVFLSACAGGVPTNVPSSAEVSPTESQVEFVGTVGAMAPAAWTVSGQVLGITPDTEVRDTIALGDTVRVHALVAADGSVTALEIALAHGDTPAAGQPGDEIEFFGTVEAIGANAWTVAGQSIGVTAETEIKGTIVVGDAVKVHALVNADGSLTAREIELAESVSSEDSAGSEAEFSGTVEAITLEAWTVNGLVVAITSETEIHDAIVVGDQVRIHAMVAPDGTLTAREIELEHDDDPAAGMPGEEIEFFGTVQAISAAAWTVRGRAIAITSNTEINGVIGVGDPVKVHAIVETDGSLTAREIELGIQASIAGDNSGRHGADDAATPSSQGTDDSGGDSGGNSGSGHN